MSKDKYSPRNRHYTILHKIIVSFLVSQGILWGYSQGHSTLKEIPHTVYECSDHYTSSVIEKQLRAIPDIQAYKVTAHPSSINIFHAGYLNF